MKINIYKYSSGFRSDIVVYQNCYCIDMNVRSLVWIQICMKISSGYLSNDRRILVHYIPQHFTSKEMVLIHSLLYRDNILLINSKLCKVIILLIKHVNHSMFSNAQLNPINFFSFHFNRRAKTHQSIEMHLDSTIQPNIHLT